MPDSPTADIKLETLSGHTHTVAEWLVVFNLMGVVIDPYTHQSGWILPTAARLFAVYEEADVRCAFVVCSDAQGARSFLGRFADDYLVLLDPEREFVRSLGLERLPALVHVAQDASVVGAAQGWKPEEWTAVIDGIEEAMDWRSRPVLPTIDDPGNFEGTPALG
ncbi:redoxin family protein [Candidatus Poriferisodalis sp.]|uniref:redoxin family protein n=1 Tax=Candidatus Poriferisodalis sp. TaxID=3101277 RepID=UPI003B02BF82